MTNQATWYVDTNGDGIVTVNNYGVIRFKVSVGSYNPGQRAEVTAGRLNTIFADTKRELDFITPAWISSDYVVASAHVRRGDGQLTFKNYPYTIYEDLYDTNLNLICTVTTADATSYGMNPAALALNWARNIRGALQSSDLNCLNEHVNSSRQLIVPTQSYVGNKNVTATYYGMGEQLLNPYTSNGEIFHTCDLTIASGLSDLPRNCWVKVTYSGKSIIARVNDTAPANIIDLSYGGIAKALGFPGSGTVNISAP